MKVIEIPQLLPSGGRLTGYLHEPDDFFIHRGRRPAVVVIRSEEHTSELQSR